MASYTTRAGSELWTGIGNVPAEVQGWFDQALLDFLPNDFIYMGYGERRNIPANSGRNINLERPNLLTASTTAVDEYATPVGQQFSTTAVQATIAWYGTHVPFSSRAVSVGLIGNLLGKIKEVLAVHKKDTFDQLTRDALMAGTSAVYIGGSARTDVNSLITAASITTAVQALNAANVKPITGRIEPSTGVGTKGMNPAFVMFGHTDLFADIVTAAGTNWLDVADYPSHQSLLTNEVGTIRSVAGKNVRVCLSNNGKIWPGGGAAGTATFNDDGTNFDVYGVVIFGEKAYIETMINGKTNGVIVQPLGSAGADDPMKQRGSIAWHDPYVAFISDNNRIYRIECACTGSS